LFSFYKGGQRKIYVRLAWKSTYTKEELYLELLGNSSIISYVFGRASTIIMGIKHILLFRNRRERRNAGEFGRKIHCWSL